jgi:phosphoenolpyruvate carboxykinase (GTP)
VKHLWNPQSGETRRPPQRPLHLTVSQCPSLSAEWDDPEGVPIDAIIFGGRRSTLFPSLSKPATWSHGVFLGATIASERTAAAEGTVGEAPP